NLATCLACWLKLALLIGQDISWLLLNTSATSNPSTQIFSQVIYFLPASMLIQLVPSTHISCNFHRRFPNFLINTHHLELFPALAKLVNLLSLKKSSMKRKLDLNLKPSTAMILNGPIKKANFNKQAKHVAKLI